MSSSINPGRLKHKISFLKNEVTRDSEGFKVSSLSSFLTTKCAVTSSSYVDNKRSSSKNLDSYDRMIYITLRYDARITKSCIVEFQGEKFRIKSFENVDYENHWLKLVIQSD